MYCENIPSSRSQPDEPDDSVVEQWELQDDRSLQLAYGSEVVDDIDGAAASDHEQDEENLSEDD